MLKFLKSLYLSAWLFAAAGIVILMFILSYFFPWLLSVSYLVLIGLSVLLLTDILILYSHRNGIMARREMMDKLSNGDLNDIRVHIDNRYTFPVHLLVIDELPEQFQSRNLSFSLLMGIGAKKILQYSVRPVKRGEYRFGAVNIYAMSPLHLVQRRYKFSEDVMVPVYPSFIQMRKFELLAISHRLTEAGVKKIRKIGHNMEFEQIKEYVPGDDYRTVNWKATARRNRLMVNSYQDEKSQQVYSLIDLGRVMKMPFEEMSLLDYSINASLVISNIAMLKYDKAGIITFAHKVQQVLPADRKGMQLHKIMELLYNQKTGYLETDYEKLYAIVRTRITQRSLLLLFTNFESFSGMQRQLSYLRKIARDHLLVVIFFENTELRTFLDKRPGNTQEIYYKTIAEKFAYEKKLIVKELEKYGIHSIYTAPQNLSVNTINKYLELKARGLI